MGVPITLQLFTLELVTAGERACSAGIVCHLCPSVATCALRHEPVKSS